MLTDFLLFISHPNYLDINHIILDTPEIQWRKFLEKNMNIRKCIFCLWENL